MIQNLIFYHQLHCEMVKVFVDLTQFCSQFHEKKFRVETKKLFATKWPSELFEILKNAIQSVNRAPEEKRLVGKAVALCGEAESTPMIV